jgi:putative Ca2+/H+ antiporter (TMEM165/GDT1 family)
LRELFTMFLTIFIAELGDKTQLATLMFVAENKAPPWAVFAASATALTAAAGLGVLLGMVGGKFVTQLPIKLIAGLGFMILGGFSLADYFRGV